MKTIINCKSVYFIFIYCIINWASVAFAQKAGKKSFTVVNVIAEDTAMLRGTWLTFNINTQGINTDYPGYTQSYTRKINEKIMRMIIPLSSTSNYGRIELDSETLFTGRFLQNKPLDYNNNLFLFQSGDTVTLHLFAHKNGAFFTGKNADKYNCMYRIGNSDEIVSFDKSNYYFKLKDFEKAIICQKLQHDSIYNVQLKILNEYKGKLNSKVYNLIRSDCWGAYNHYVVDLYFTNALTTRNKELYKAAKNLFFKDYGSYKETLFKDPGLLVESYKYCDFLTAKEKAYAVIMNSKTFDKGSYDDLKFAYINGAIDLHYKKGIEKDKLKLLAFLDISGSKLADFADYMNEAVDEAGNNQFKTALIEFRAANTPGTNAYSFELPDQNGKINKLSDFKGKLVIMDFWFTGCHGCFGMAKVLKPIVAAFKSNPNVVFLTVSIDGDQYKELWRKSLTEEKYSSKDEINLLAAEGRKSPIISHYHIDAFPTLIAISKEGKIISVIVPDPRDDELAFKDFIEKNLH